MLDENDLQKLLRLKRHEQPPPAYFENFLEEFQRRQRTELLRRPLRQLIADRIGTFFQQFALPRYAYAAASVAVLGAVGLTTLNIAKSPGGVGPLLADEPSAAAPSLTIASAVPREPLLHLNTQRNVAGLQLLPVDLRQARVINAGSSPYYTLDARPVNYEREVQF